MTYYLIAFFMVAGPYLPLRGNVIYMPEPRNLGTFATKEACTDAAHKAELILKQHGGAAICVQSK